MGTRSMTRILAVDPGDVRIGLAISDPTRTIAQPLRVLQHISRDENAREICRIAIELQATEIVVGVALDLDGEIGPQARKALRLVRALREQGNISVHTWDETGSTQAASRGDIRHDALDARAAAVILQEYLDARKR
jgi:putative Holliday junction resolvase